MTNSTLECHAKIDRGSRGQNSTLQKDWASVLKLYQKRGNIIKQLGQLKADLRQQLYQEKKASQLYLDTIMAQADTICEEAMNFRASVGERKAEAKATIVGAKYQFVVQIRSERAATSRANKNREDCHATNMQKLK